MAKEPGTTPETNAGVSLPVPTVVQALVGVMRDVDHVAKTGRNESQKFNFRGIDAVMNAVGPALRTHGVVVFPQLINIRYESTGTSNGKTASAVYVEVSYTFIGPGGDSLVCTVPAEAIDYGDKGTAKVMSVAFRTALLQTLCLPTDDPDPDESSYERAAPQRHAPANGSRPKDNPPPEPQPARRVEPVTLKTIGNIVDICAANDWNVSACVKGFTKGNATKVEELSESQGNALTEALVAKAVTVLDTAAN